MNLKEYSELQLPEEIIKAIIEDIICAGRCDLKLLGQLGCDRLRREIEQNGGELPTSIKMPGGYKRG